MKVSEPSAIFKSVTASGSETRVDVNGDRITDIMRSVNGNTTTDIFNSKSGQNFLIKQTGKEEDVYVQGSIVADVAQVDSIVRVNNTKEVSTSEIGINKSEICGKIEGNLKKYRALDLDSFTNRQTQLAVDSMFDESCDDDDSRVETASALTNFYYSLLGREGKTSCLDNLVADAKKSFNEKKISEQEYLQYELVRSEARADAADLLEGKAKTPQFICESSDKPSFKIQEDQKIKISYSKKSSAGTTQASLLKKWGMPGDADEALKKCVQGASMFADKKRNSLGLASIDLIKSNMNNVSSTQSVVSSPSILKSQVEASKQEVAAVNKVMAETKITIPSPTESSPQTLAKIQTTQGDTAVQQVVQKQSSGILSMTNAVMSAVNTKAVASSGSSRSVASTSDSSSLSSSRNKSKSSIGGLKKTTIGKNEQIVEEILVGESSARSAQAAGSRSGQKASASAARGLASTGNNGPQLAGSDAAVSAASAVGGDNAELGATSGGGGGGGGFSGGGSRGGGNKSKGGPAVNAAANGNSRSPASTGGGAADQVSSDEIVSFIKNSDYQSTKAKLQDYKFQNKLKANSITIIDRSGNSVGAAEGQIIFVDKGNRFEKQ